LLTDRPVCRAHARTALGSVSPVAATAGADLDAVARLVPCAFDAFDALDLAVGALTAAGRRTRRPDSRVPASAKLFSSLRRSPSIDPWVEHTSTT
jgi:hypothetical protein